MQKDGGTMSFYHQNLPGSLPASQPLILVLRVICRMTGAFPYRAAWERGLEFIEAEGDAWIAAGASPHFTYK